MQLVIVESPTKARKLRSYLGSDFTIEASVGHVRDLPQKKLGVDVDKNFEPEYEVVPGKQKVISQLKKLAKTADTIYLAMDPDREGEAIAWHVQTLLHDAAPKKTVFLRSVFHEITKPAVMAAIEKPGEISTDLVNAQQARRVVDRLVGYKVSPVLWKKIRRGLSAGRVQSVALRLIVEREREIEAFRPEEYWELDVALSTKQLGEKVTIFVDGKVIEELPESLLVARVIELDRKKYQPTKQVDVSGVVELLPAAAYTVSQVERTERRRWSLPPFTTSTLQQVAANRLGMTSKQTMSLAQQLYEEGLITYHRTDSVALSQQSVAMARDYVEKVFGAKYVPEKPRYFANRSKNAQEAHEAIRVTEATVTPDQVISKAARLTTRHQKLYDLIWRRFLASQMDQAVYDQTSVLIAADFTQTPVTSEKLVYQQATLKSNGSVLKFDGWMRLFPQNGDTILPAVEEKQGLDYVDLNAAQKFTQPPARYNDASLVKELEKRGIGRPSTYASIISVIEERSYVERDQKRFIPTAIGMTVSDFLVKHFSQFMEYDFTAEMEEDLDRIARGEKAWRTIVGSFFGPLAKTISQVEKDADRVQIPVEKTGEQCPQCGPENGGEVVIRSGKFGKFLSCSRFPECNYTKNLVEKVAGVVCPLCQEGEVVVKQSRWGKSFFGCSRYPACDWASWKKPEVGETITAEAWAVHQAARAERKAARQASHAAKSGGVSDDTSKKSSSRKKATRSRKKTGKKQAKKS